MSITGASKTAIDSIYAYRFIRLMQKDFTNWEAYHLGLINDKGSVIKRPKTDAEKSAYTPFHGAVRALKKMMSTIPGVTAWASIQSSLAAIGSRFSLTEAELELMEESIIPLYESMVAGDSGGDPEKIASGETSGVITLNNKKLKKKIN